MTPPIGHTFPKNTSDSTHNPYTPSSNLDPYTVLTNYIKAATPSPPPGPPQIVRAMEIENTRLAAENAALQRELEYYRKKEAIKAENELLRIELVHCKALRFADAQIHLSNLAGREAEINQLRKENEALRGSERGFKMEEMENGAGDNVMLMKSRLEEVERCRKVAVLVAVGAVRDGIMAEVKKEEVVGIIETNLDTLVLAKLDQRGMEANGFLRRIEEEQGVIDVQMK